MTRCPVVYLTGVPASGKTTLIKALREKSSGILVLEYSEILAAFLTEKYGHEVVHEDLRRSSSAIITKTDVERVDRLLVSTTRSARAQQPVVIVSHPATRERYGLRVLMFSQELLNELSPTSICMLTCSADTIEDRVKKNAEGRPDVARHQTELHISVQVSIATTYAFSLGVPLYFLDSIGPLADNVRFVERICGCEINPN